MSTRSSWRRLLNTCCVDERTACTAPGGHGTTRVNGLDLNPGTCCADILLRLGLLGANGVMTGARQCVRPEVRCDLALGPDGPVRGAHPPTGLMVAAALRRGQQRRAVLGVGRQRRDARALHTAQRGGAAVDQAAADARSVGPPARQCQPASLRKSAAKAALFRRRSGSKLVAQRHLHCPLAFALGLAGGQVFGGGHGGVDVLAVGVQALVVDKAARRAAG